MPREPMPIKVTESVNAARRPNRSAYLPNIQPPSGRTRKPTAKMPAVFKQLRCLIPRWEEHACEVDAERRVGVPVVPLDQVAERSANHVAGHRSRGRRFAGVSLVQMHVP